jgi:uncharacterized Ntn-hydrolase superfamily protein
MTFSIVAHDHATDQWGVAVQSKFLAAAAVVPFAEADIGALATQAYANTAYGPRGLELMRLGLAADDVLRELIKNDGQREQRQLGLVDAQGRAAAFTGRECLEWAGHIVGDGFCCQGNILANKLVVTEMARAFEHTQGALAARLIAALAAGQAAGGDRRGQQSAGVLVVQARGGYGGYNDRLLDLRVDDHPTPIAELERLYHLHQLYFGKPRPEDLLPIAGELARELQRLAQRAGYYTGALSGEWDADTRAAFTRLIHTENLEEREQPDDKVDRVVVEFLRERFG